MDKALGFLVRMDSVKCQQMLVQEAFRWLGMLERGDNQGQFVEKVQESVFIGGHPREEPWCMDFVHFCVNAVNDNLQLLGGFEWDLLLKSESCLSVFQSYFVKGHKVYKEPKFGHIAIWDVGKGHGHCGIVVKNWHDEPQFHTVEGNTTDPHGRVPKSRQGVFLKMRHVDIPSGGNWVLKGFIDPWDGFNARETAGNYTF